MSELGIALRLMQLYAKFEGLSLILSQVIEWNRKVGQGHAYHNCFKPLSRRMCTLNLVTIGKFFGNVFGRNIGEHQLTN